MTCSPNVVLFQANSMLPYRECYPQEIKHEVYMFFVTEQHHTVYHVPKLP